MTNRSVQSGLAKLGQRSLARSRLKLPARFLPVLNQLCDESLSVCTRWRHLLNELRRLHRQLGSPSLMEQSTDGMPSALNVSSRFNHLRFAQLMYGESFQNFGSRALSTTLHVC